ncbi:vacuolar import and degradation protein-domain-containing protein [Rhodotorula diobovata]|uniref:Vacuolar import and degradation protein-domain-containing protein n=1 Tax=Rhodotorula diobovata TaxID=5288 RepID=A0A5C5FY20_9BASI|nr:vacuolar import and degradation protein-domain-containing protein [Rhodotorula diobovata]
MRAHGVAIPASTASTAAGAPPPPVGDVTTFFSGSILHPILDGLFCSPSPTGSGSAGGGEFHVTRASEAESWVQLGPFKGLAKGELLECAKSRTWVEERTRGWVLFRWKERDFVNVTAKESSLSISGFYHVVLNRQTGEVEGLYHDPAATPHQRLVLSPADNDRGAFGLGSFAYR